MRFLSFITENLAVNGEGGERSFFAYTGLEILEDVPLCRREFKRRHSPPLPIPQGSLPCEPLEPADEAGGAKPQLNAVSIVLQGEVAHILL